MAKTIVSMSMLVLHTLGIFTALVTVKACPGICQTKYSNTSCECVGKEISSLESLNLSSLPTSINTLDLRYNKISELTSSAFANLAQLSVIDLSHNIITEIKPMAFYHLPDIRILYLSYNRISEIKLLTFSKLLKLYKLHLDGNKITTISQIAFDNLTALKSLDLRYNKISELTSSAFANLAQLTTIDLSHNRISEIKPMAFSHLPNITNLYLSYNRISEIKLLTFSKLLKLDKLYLDGNKITTISQFAFDNLTALTRLHMAWTGLSLGTVLCSLLPIYRRHGNIVSGLPRPTLPTCNVDIQCYDFPNRPQKAFCPCTSGMVYDGKQCSMPVVSSCLQNTTLPATPCTLPPNCTSNGHVFSCYCPLGTYLNNDQCDSSNLTILNVTESSILLTLDTDSYLFPNTTSNQLQIVAQSSTRKYNFTFLLSATNSTVQLTGLAPGMDYEISIPNTYFTNIDIKTITPNLNEIPSDDSGNGAMTNPSAMTTTDITTDTDSSNTTANTDSSNTTAVAVGVSMGVLLIAAVGLAILVKTRKFSQLGELKNNFLQAGMSSHALTKAASVVRMSTSKLSRQFSGAASEAETVDDTSKCGAPVTYENQDDMKVGLKGQTSVSFFVASAEEKNSYETVSQADNSVNEAKQVETNLNTTGTDQHEPQSGESGCAISLTSASAQTNGRA